MVELQINLAQMVVLACCAGAALWRALSLRSRPWALLALFFGAYLLGDLYWCLYLVFYGVTPPVSLIPYVSWYVSFLFLWLALGQAGQPVAWRIGIRQLWPVPVFVCAMCAYYLRYGAYLSNMVAALLMGMLLWHCAGELWLRRPGERRTRGLPAAVLLFCALEYAMWTASCIWEGYTWANPYHWFEAAQCAAFVVILAAAWKAGGAWRA